MIHLMVPTFVIHSLVMRASFKQLALFGLPRNDFNSGTAFGLRAVSSKANRAQKSQVSAPYIEIGDLSSDGWKLSPAIEILKEVRIHSP